MISNAKVDNEQVREIYKRWLSVWENTECSLETRLKAFSILRVIEALAVIYESDETLDEEVIDDLFIAWSKDFKPLLPEERPALLKQIQKQIEKLNQ